VRTMKTNTHQKRFQCFSYMKEDPKILSQLKVSGFMPIKILCYQHRAHQYWHPVLNEPALHKRQPHGSIKQFSKSK